ncbi:MAG: AraC family transcriptional regulator [Myxococcota bacterium]
MDLHALARTLESKIETSSGTVDGLGWLQRRTPTEFEATIYTPIACLILRGEKVATIGDQRHVVPAGRFIIVSHDLPVLSRITAAPYLALVAKLDLNELRGLHDEIGDQASTDEPAHAYAVSTVDEAVFSVLNRYVDLIDDAESHGVLVPLLRRELHFRLLQTPSGSMLRSLLRRDSHASSISRAIRTLREQFREALEVPALARSVGMSTSSFHRHFKDVTHTTPLQFQKDLRLTEARRLLVTGGHTVSGAAFAVGYESPTQFSREYSRKFGAAPRDDRVGEAAIVS